ncbi:zf-HC2 domain-containing protein [bacterium]|nr:zf-HC2 domain-containing protein [bacterium]
MEKCEYEYLIDDYLLNKLDKKEKERFEHHYFNCPSCFEKMRERNELISVVKKRGDAIFQGTEVPEETQRVPWRKKVFAFLTPKQWAAVGASAALILAVVLLVIPQLKTSSPEFFVNKDLVRSKSINLISPVIDIKTIPPQFRWKSLGEDVHYKIYIYNSELLWSAETQENSITLPGEVKEKMSAGEEYSWQVKAFSPEGSLIAVSSKVRFKISPN